MNPKKGSIAGLGVIMVAKDAEDVIGDALGSVKDIAGEIVVVDDFSKDKTADIASEYGAMVYLHKQESEGSQKAFALYQAKSPWILVLDTDEKVSSRLADEIGKTLSAPASEGYMVPFENYFLGRPVRHGGEDYKIFRLFRRDAVTIDPSEIHVNFRLKAGQPGRLTQPIIHRSYRSIGQLFRKFTSYAFREARQKHEAGEKINFKKLFLYGPHMFWARFAESGGYRDGGLRIILDLAFAYMEALTYWIIFIKYQLLNRFPPLRE